MSKSSVAKADVYILTVKRALRTAQEHHTIIVGDDPDLLVLFCSLLSAPEKSIFRPETEAYFICIMGHVETF